MSESYYDKETGQWKKGKPPVDYVQPVGGNKPYVAPKSTDTFQYVAPEAYKAQDSQFNNTYYDALRNKYASDTQATLTSPEMAESAKQTRSQLAGMGVLGGSAYGNIQSQRVGGIQRAGDKALADALSQSRMQEQEYNRGEAAKVAQSQYDISMAKAGAETQWGLGQGDRDRGALDDAKKSIKSQIDLLPQLTWNSTEADVERYNYLVDQLMQLEAGGDVADVDYASQKIMANEESQFADKYQSPGDMGYIADEAPSDFTPQGMQMNGGNANVGNPTAFKQSVKDYIISTPLNGIVSEAEIDAILSRIPLSYSNNFSDARNAAWNAIVKKADQNYLTKSGKKIIGG